MLAIILAALRLLDEKIRPERNYPFLPRPAMTRADILHARLRWTVECHRRCRAWAV
jgi:hypothetical protein